MSQLSALFHELATLLHVRFAEDSHHGIPEKVSAHAYSWNLTTRNSILHTWPQNCLGMRAQLASLKIKLSVFPQSLPWSLKGQVCSEVFQPNYNVYILSSTNILSLIVITFRRHRFHEQKPISDIQYDNFPKCMIIWRFREDQNVDFLMHS